MYITTQANDRPQQVGLRGFSAPPPPSDSKESSMKAIRRALRLNPAGGYVKRSPARNELDEAFNSVPPSFARDLRRELEERKTALAKCFRYRLAGPTRLTMLKILEVKADWFEKYRKDRCEQQKLDNIRKEFACRKDYVRSGRTARLEKVDPVECKKVTTEVEETRAQDQRGGVDCQ